MAGEVVMSPSGLASHAVAEALAQAPQAATRRRERAGGGSTNTQSPQSSREVIPPTSEQITLQEKASQPSGFVRSRPKILTQSARSLF
jgi:hypothetical protein